MTSHHNQSIAGCRPPDRKPEERNPLESGHKPVQCERKAEAEGKSIWFLRPSIAEQRERVERSEVTPNHLSNSLLTDLFISISIAARSRFSLHHQYPVYKDKDMNVDMNLDWNAEFSMPNLEG